MSATTRGEQSSVDGLGIRKDFVQIGLDQHQLGVFAKAPGGFATHPRFDEFLGVILA